MRRRIYAFFPVIILTFMVSACGLLQEPAEATAPIEAVPLQPEPDTSAAEESVPEQAEDDAGTDPATGELRVFAISPASSEVRFELDEDLRGQRITVVGTTDQIAGEIAFDLSDLSTTQLGVIRINARTLATDNDFRNRAIANEILDTRTHEFITFTPTAINGLSGSAAIGEEFAFTVDGELTIRDITRPVSFDVIATAISDAQISGRANAVVQRSDFDLRIPSVRNVANVEEEVELYIDFSAATS